MKERLGYLDDDELAKVLRGNAERVCSTSGRPTWFRRASQLVDRLVDRHAGTSGSMSVEFR